MTPPFSFELVYSGNKIVAGHIYQGGPRLATLENNKPGRRLNNGAFRLLLSELCGGLPIPPAPAEKPADLAPKAPAGLLRLWREDATRIAADLARQALRAALNGEEGQAARSYLTDSGPLFCRATYDGESVVTAWDIEGRPLSRASAETIIAGRLASRFDQGKGLK